MRDRFLHRWIDENRGQNGTLNFHLLNAARIARKFGLLCKNLSLTHLSTKNQLFDDFGALGGPQGIDSYIGGVKMGPPWGLGSSENKVRASKKHPLNKANPLVLPILKK